VKERESEKNGKGVRKRNGGIGPHQVWGGGIEALAAIEDNEDVNEHWK